MIDKTNIINEFNRIKNLGFIKSHRPNNLDGGIGNTFEDHLGVKENNLKSPDFDGFEVKCKKELNSSYISLFSKSPTHPKGANAFLKDKYGELRSEEFPELKKLYASVFGHRIGIVYEKYSMKLSLNRVEKKLYLEIIDLSNNELYRDVYWSFDELIESSNKMKSLFVVYADHKKIDNVFHYHYTRAEIYVNFNFDKFITCIENGKIMFDIRIGVHKTGKVRGKPHDHGSGFRVKKENIYELYDEVIKTDNNLFD